MQKNINIQFGTIIKRFRNERGWTQETLADRSGLNRNYISLIEQGRKSPSLNTLSQLAAALNMRISTLLEDCEPKEPLQ